MTVCVLFLVTWKEARDWELVQFSACVETPRCRVRCLLQRGRTEPQRPSPALLPVLCFLLELSFDSCPKLRPEANRSLPVVRPEAAGNMSEGCSGFALGGQSQDRPGAHGQVAWQARSPQGQHLPPAPSPTLPLCASTPGPLTQSPASSLPREASPDHLL